MWMVQSAIHNRSLTVRLTRTGLEERSCFGARRLPLEQIGGLDFQDVARQLERLKPVQNRRLTGVQPNEIYAVLDREDRMVFRLTAEMEPKETFEKMRERIEKRLRPR